jgi:hypothetical protein
MGNDKFLSVVGVIAVIVIIVSLAFTIISLKDLSSKISGFVSNAEANLTIEQNIEVNFTTRAISWGAGKVNSGNAAALTTYGTNNVTSGNWTLTTAGGLRLRNEGNTNVTLNLSVGKSAANFIGGTSPIYQWNVSDVEVGSCVNSTGGTYTPESGFNLSRHIPTSTTTIRICGNFTYVSGADDIRIDFNLTVPEDATAGAKGDVITATAWVNQ